MPAILRCFRIAGFLFSKEGCYITQNEVNAVFDEQVRLCADTLKRKTKEYTGDAPDRLGAFKAAAALQHAAQIRVNEKRVAQAEGFKAKLYENLVSGILTKEEFLSYKRKYNADIELFQKAIAEWNEKLTDVLENRSERNRWINHFMKFSTMEGIDRRAVMQLIRSIRVMGKDELHIEFNYQDEYQKAISLAEQIATKNEERMVG